MTRIWFYLKNTFLTVGRTSYKKTLSIARGHVCALFVKKDEEDILLMHDRILPVYDAFSDLYAIWMAYKGAVRGQTARFKELLSQLQTKMYNWDLHIQLVFPEKSSDYVFLFHNGRKPFNQGTYEQRISAIESLSIKLLEYEAFASIQSEVLQYHKALRSARNVQQGKVGMLKATAREMKTAHLNLGIMLYANLGMLMSKYAANPEKVQMFFDLELIRSPKKKKNTGFTNIFTLRIPVNISKEAGISFSVDSILLFYNDSIIPLEVYTATDKNDPIPAQTITINPDEEKRMKVNELGTPGNRFLFVVNHDMHEEGRMEITLVK